MCVYSINPQRRPSMLSRRHPSRRKESPTVHFTPLVTMLFGQLIEGWLNLLSTYQGHSPAARSPLWAIWRGRRKRMRSEEWKSPLTLCESADFMVEVEVTGLEPATAWSQTRNATNCATPRFCGCKGTHFQRPLQIIPQFFYLIMPCSTKIFFSAFTERSTCSSVWVAMRA